MSIERIFGLILVLLGVGIILYSMYYSFQIFTGSIEPPELFSMSEQSTNSRSPVAEDDIQGQINFVLQEQLSQILPKGILPRMLNFSMWSLFSGLMFFGGAQLAGIGIKLLRVKRERNDTP